MEWIRLEAGRPKEAAQKAAAVIKAGGVIVFPAERLYGHPFIPNRTGIGRIEPELIGKFRPLSGLKHRQRGEVWPALAHHHDLVEQGIEGYGHFHVGRRNLLTV